MGLGTERENRENDESTDKAVDREGDAQVAGGMYWRDGDVDEESTEEGKAGVRSTDVEWRVERSYS